MDSETDEPVLTDISEMPDTEGNAIDVIVRYSIVPEEEALSSSNGF